MTIVRFNLNGVPSSFITFKFKSANALTSFNASRIALLADVGNESSLLKLTTNVSLKVIILPSTDLICAVKRFLKRK